MCLWKQYTHDKDIETLKLRLVDHPLSPEKDKVDWLVEWPINYSDSHDKRLCFGQERLCRHSMQHELDQGCQTRFSSGANSGKFYLKRAAPM